MQPEDDVDKDVNFINFQLFRKLCAVFLISFFFFFFFEAQDAARSITNATIRTRLINQSRATARPLRRCSTVAICKSAKHLLVGAPRCAGCNSYKRTYRKGVAGVGCITKKKWNATSPQTRQTIWYGNPVAFLRVPSRLIVIWFFWLF